MGVSVVICLELGADLHMAQLMPLPLTVSCFSKIQIGFTFLVPAHPGSPGLRAVQWYMYVCVCVCDAGVCSSLYACVQRAVRVQSLTVSSVTAKTSVYHVRTSVTTTKTVMMGRTKTKRSVAVSDSSLYFIHRRTQRVV